MRLRRGIVVALIAPALILSGCASYIKSGAVTSFAAATTKAASLLENAAKIEVSLTKQQGFEEALDAYIKGRVNYNFPPKDFRTLDKERLAARIVVLKAISEYASALAALDDPEQSAKVGEAVSKLQSSIVTFNQVADSDFDPESIAPTTEIISAVARFFVSQRNAQIIRETSQAVHPLIVEASGLLIADFRRLNARFARNLASVRSRQIGRVKAVQEDGAPTDSGKRQEYFNDPALRIALERYFREYVLAERELNAQLEPLRESEKILTALVKAHDELRKSEESQRAINEFRTLVEGIVVATSEAKKS